ncbi:outer-membrane lipoprotein carrier protein LolA [Pelagibacteraceae bacterium]|nr:outer-membrane lipoprotein carrier protein LolA [Pelagibacteraceae bacterium]
MFKKFFIVIFVFINFFSSLYANEKQLVINKLININNITFDFEQKIKNKKEVGSCILSFNNKLICDYKDSMQKRVLINGSKLVVQQKRYDKIYFYPMSQSPFIKIFNKTNLINLIKKSKYQLNDNIEFTYVGEKKEKIIIFFNKDTYDLLGWEVVDQLQNIINFSIKIKYINSEIDSKIFKIPSIN